MAFPPVHTVEHQRVKTKKQDLCPSLVDKERRGFLFFLYPKIWREAREKKLLGCAFSQPVKRSIHNRRDAKVSSQKRKLALQPSAI